MHYVLFPEGQRNGKGLGLCLALALLTRRGSSATGDADGHGNEVLEVDVFDPRRKRRLVLVGDGRSSFSVLEVAIVPPQQFPSGATAVSRVGSLVVVVTVVVVVVVVVPKASISGM